MGRSWVRHLCAFFAGRRGAVSPILALMLVPLIGALGMGTETANWYFTQRAAQNAADAAVMAAASNGSATAPTYGQEALGVAANYNFVDGSNNVVVRSTNAATCPSGGTNCYQVTITKTVPLSLTRITGYTGNPAGTNAVTIYATAIASKPIPVSDCILALHNYDSTSKGSGKKNTGFLLDGGNSFNANGCDLFSNGGADCNGHDGGFGASFTVGSDKNCGVAPPTTGETAATDPFKNQMTSYPPSCGSGVASGTAPATLTISGCYKVNGNWTIPAGGTTITTGGTSGGILEIANGGNLTLNGTLSAAVGQGLTIIFTGSSGAPGFFAGSGEVDFGAPSQGNWSGIAVYQDPSLITQSAQNYSGSSPTFNITGLVYTPYTDLTFLGAINHQTNGFACLAFIANTLTVSGTGSIFANPTSQCYQAGLNGLPTAPNTVAVRQALVQ